MINYSRFLPRYLHHLIAVLPIIQEAPEAPKPRSCAKHCHGTWTYEQHKLACTNILLAEGYACGGAAQKDRR